MATDFNEDRANEMANTDRFIQPGEEDGAMETLEAELKLAVRVKELWESPFGTIVFNAVAERLHLRFSKHLRVTMAMLKAAAETERDLGERR